jgi:hypothetical protein
VISKLGIPRSGLSDGSDDIEAGAHALAGPQSRDQVSGDDATAAGDIDEIRAALHPREPQDIWRIGRYHDGEVGFAEALLEPAGG